MNDHWRIDRLNEDVRKLRKQYADLYDKQGNDNVRLTVLSVIALAVSVLTAIAVILS